MNRDGLTSRVTKGGIPVLRVHYSADSHKDPETPEGALWVRRAAQGYPLGTQDPAWLKEMEIQYGAMGGQALFSLWGLYKPYVVIPPFDIASAPHVKFIGTYDHGWVHNSAYLVHAILPNGMKYTVWECCAPKVPVKAMAEIIKGHMVKLTTDGRVFQGNPYAGKEVLRIADPQIWAKTGHLSDQPFNSLGDMFREKYGIPFVPGKKGGELTIAEWLIGDLWADMEHPKYQIFDTCKQLLWELPRLRYRTITAVQARTKNQPEQLVDKDNDAWDALCQFLHRFPSTVAPKPARSLAGTFAYWQKLAKDRKPLPNSYARL